MVFKFELVKFHFSQKFIKLSPLPGFEPKTSPVASRSANHWAMTTWSLFYSHFMYSVTKVQPHTSPSWRDVIYECSLIYIELSQIHAKNLDDVRYKYFENLVDVIFQPKIVSCCFTRILNRSTGLLCHRSWNRLSWKEEKRFKRRRIIWKEQKIISTRSRFHIIGCTAESITPNFWEAFYRCNSTA